jgi:hypothetical protein
MKKFNNLALRVIEATKIVIMDDIQNYELDSIDDFEDFANKDFSMMQSLWEIADKVNFIEYNGIDANDIKCLTTLKICVDYLSDGCILYEGDDNICDLGEHVPFESEKQLEEFLKYINDGINKIQA